MRARSAATAVPDSVGWIGALREALASRPTLTIADMALAAVAVLLVLVGGAIGFRPTSRALFTNSPPERRIFTEELNDKGASLPERCKVSGSPAYGEWGIYALPGKSFTLSWSYPLQKNEIPLVETWSPRPPQIEATVVFRTPEGEERLSLPRSGASTVLVPKTLRSAARDGETAEVRMEFAAAASLGGPALALDKAIFGARGVTNGAIEPLAWWILPAALLPLLLFFLWLATGRAHCAARVLLLSLAAGIAALGALWTGAFVSAGIIFLATATIAGILLCFDAGTAGPRQNGKHAANTFFATRRLALSPEWILCAGLACAVLAVRWSLYALTWNVPLMADAVHYYDLASRMRNPLDTLPREPLHMDLIWLFCTLTSWSSAGVRFYTVTCSVLEGIALYAVARLLLPRWISAVVLLLYAFNPILIQSAPLGLREELFPLLTLALLGSTVKLIESAPSVRANVRSAIWGALVVLTRVSGLLVFPLLYAAAQLPALRSRQFHLRAAGIALLVFAVPVATMLGYHKAVRGDAMISSNIVAKFYRNTEFAGKPGYPTKDQLEHNAFAGAPVTMSEYLFRDHSFSDVVHSMGYGMYRMFIGDVASKSLLRVGVPQSGDQSLAETPREPADYVLYSLYLIGVIYCLLSLRGWMVLLCIWSVQLPLAFLAGKDLLHVRLMMNTTPLMLLVAGLGIAAIIKSVQIARRAVSGGDLHTASSRHETPQSRRPRRKTALRA